ncbi:hypothetical protein B0H13DRAFT_1879279 [Mycena leptocephala]|nr:hypothetical protein B0H13DRAFT_1879279 [Mycena leptocephala]
MSESFKIGIPKFISRTSKWTNKRQYGAAPTEGHGRAHGIRRGDARVVGVADRQGRVVLILARYPSREKNLKGLGEPLMVTVMFQESFVLEIQGQQQDFPIIQVLDALSWLEEQTEGWGPPTKIRQGRLATCFRSSSSLSPEYSGQSSVRGPGKVVLTPIAERFFIPHPFQLVLLVFKAGGRGVSATRSGFDRVINKCQQHVSSSALPLTASSARLPVASWAGKMIYLLRAHLPLSTHRLLRQFHGSRALTSRRVSPPSRPHMALTTRRARAALTLRRARLFPNFRLAVLNLVGSLDSPSFGRGPLNFGTLGSTPSTEPASQGFLSAPSTVAPADETPRYREIACDLCGKVVNCYKNSIAPLRSHRNSKNCKKRVERAKRELEIAGAAAAARPPPFGSLSLRPTLEHIPVEVPAQRTTSDPCFLRGRELARSQCCAYSNSRSRSPVQGHRSSSVPADAYLGASTSGNDDEDMVSPPCPGILLDWAAPDRYPWGIHAPMSRMNLIASNDSPLLEIGSMSDPSIAPVLLVGQVVNTLETRSQSAPAHTSYQYPDIVDSFGLMKLIHIHLYHQNNTLYLVTSSISEQDLGSKGPYASKDASNVAMCSTRILGPTDCRLVVVVQVIGVLVRRFWVVESGSFDLDTP